MDIHEYQAKEILANFGVKVPQGALAYSPEQAAYRAREMGGERWIVKAQVHAGGRGKAGGVKLCSSDTEIQSETENMFGRKLVTHQTGPEGKGIYRVYVEAAVPIDREFYVGFVLDRTSQRVMIVASAEGGMEIEEISENKPDSIVRGQYNADEDQDSYIAHSENPESKTESYIAMKVDISNWRWKGTPFYLRTGKRLKGRMSEIVVHFKEVPHSIFGEEAGSKANVLAIRLQPDEGMDLRVTIKEPGPGGMRLVDVPLDMTFADALGPEGADVPDAYERLIMDVIRGNQTLFMRGDEVEAAWAWTDPIIQGWEARNDVPKPYDSGSDGPTDANELMRRDQRQWREYSA